MKKIVRQQNYLKELIESQENKYLSRQTLKCLIRAALEPLLDKPEIGVVLYRIINPEGLIGMIKRLEFSEIEAYDYSDESDNLRERVWADTEFLCVLTHRFVSILLWDNKTDDKEKVRYYSVCNSRLQSEALDIINRNSILDIKHFQEQFRPDRRDNILLNASIRKLIENMDEASKDAVLGFAEEQTTELPVQSYDTNTRAIAHEIKNQLSICDLYTEVLKRYCKKNEIEDDTITNALNCLTRAYKMANNALVGLKSIAVNNLKPHSLKALINTAENLTKVYFECKNIRYIVENSVDEMIMADEDKFIAALINLVKNAVEAFGIEEENLKNGKYIKIKTEKSGDFALIRVSNNAGEINNPEKIFEAGYTTKSGGSGLGLMICKKSLEEQLGQLNLEHTGSDYTEFVIKIGLV